MPRGLQMAKKALANHELLTVAVYLLKGESQRVDTEDVAVKANKLAPGRYTWRKYPDQINLELIRVYLSDAKKKEKGRYLAGSGNSGWMLTRAGLEFARTHAEGITSTPQSNVTTRLGHWQRRERG